MRERVCFGSPICAAIAVVTAALVGTAGLNPAALAQQAKSASIPTDDLFLPDTVDFKPGDGAVARLVNFVKQAQTPGSQCPTDVDFTVFDSSSDKLWAESMAAARRDAIEGVLRGFGPSVRVTAKSTGGIISAVIISAQGAKDKEKPKLDTTSNPRKGKKVKAGDKIKVTMVARDHANLWQSGIKTIQLVAESEGGRFIASENFPPAPVGCTALPPERRVEATYEVPSNPPPIVRLAALAEDHAGHMDTDVGEFPTQGDWYGTFGWTHTCTGGGSTDVTRGTGDLTLDHDGQGNLTGTLVGSVPERKMTMPTCSGYALVTPGTFRAKLLGSYTPAPDRFLVQAADGQTTQGRASLTCPAGSSTFEQAFFTAYEGPIFREAFRDLRRQPDDSRTSTGESTMSAGGGTCTTTYSLTLRPVQN